MALALPLVQRDALARSGNGQTFKLGLSVPTVCHIELSGRPQPPGMAATAEEFCNSASGYQVLALHDALAPGERVWFDYGGRRVAANATGTTILADEVMAGHRVRPFAIIAQGAVPVALSSLTLQITPR